MFYLEMQHFSIYIFFCYHCNISCVPMSLDLFFSFRSNLRKSFSFLQHSAPKSQYYCISSRMLCICFLVTVLFIRLFAARQFWFVIWALRNCSRLEHSNTQVLFFFFVLVLGILPVVNMLLQQSKLKYGCKQSVLLLSPTSNNLPCVEPASLNCSCVSSGASLRQWFSNLQ